MELQKEWDVVIVGAGPAGSTAAGVIASRGFKVLLIDRDKYPGYSNCCGGAMSVALADKLNLTDRVIEKRIFSFCRHDSIFVNRWTSKRPIAITVYRRVLDKFLADRAVSFGAKLLVRTRVTGVDRAGPVIYATGLDDGRHLQFKSKIVIFANGASPLAHKTFDIGIIRGPENSGFGLVYELENKDNSLDTCETYLDLISVPLGYYWIFPKRGRLNVGVGCVRSAIKKNLKGCLDDFIQGHPELKDKAKVRVRAGLIPFRLARRFVADSALVIGDAAGMVDLFTGAGLAHAVRSAELSGEACLRALKLERYDERTLAYYPRRLHRAGFFWQLRMTGLIFKVALSLSRRESKIAHLLLIMGNQFLVQCGRLLFRLKWSPF